MGLFSLWLAAAMLTSVECARILAMIPYNARSHFVVMEPLLLALQDRGHHLTVVSSFPQKQPLSNYRDIDLSDKLPAVISNYTIDSIKEKMPDLFKSTEFIIDLHYNVCEIVFRDDRVMSLLNEKFDLMIGEIFGCDCFNYFAHKMKIPFISWVTSTALPWMSERTGFPDDPTYIPNYFVSFGAQMSIRDRMWNSFTLMYVKWKYFVRSHPPAEALANSIFQESLPSMSEVNVQTSLVFINSFFSFVQSRPFPPNVVEVGGIHIKERKPLPLDLQQILADSGPMGVLLVSFGSLVRTASLPKPVLQTMMDVFAALPALVIMKYEEDLPDAPKNVFVRKWLPQTDLIGHSAVRAVVSHCGLASTIEAVTFAKPVVAIPFFSDQFQNSMHLVRRGGGIMLDIDSLTFDNFYDAIMNVLKNTSYEANMKNMSRLFRDRPMTALQTAVYWTEYVIRHQGAPHLRPASVNLPYYEQVIFDFTGLKLISALFLALFVHIAVRMISFLGGGAYKLFRKKQKVKNEKTD